MPAASSRAFLPPADDGVLLETRGLVKVYGHRAVVKGVSLKVRPGEVVGLLGPNGAGKTTTFRMVVGMILPDQGEVWHRGVNITRLPMYQRARRGIGYLTQDPSVFGRLTVEENILAILEYQDLSRAERKKRLELHLADLGLTRLRDAKAATLSGGERRRLEVTRALVTNPTLLFLDEPFVGIDPIAVGEIKTMVRDLKARGISVVITDHNVEKVLPMTDRSYVIQDGEVMFSGTPPEVIEDEAVREVYLGTDFRLPEVEAARAAPRRPAADLARADGADDRARERALPRWMVEALREQERRVRERRAPPPGADGHDAPLRGDEDTPAAAGDAPAPDDAGHAESRPHDQHAEAPAAEGECQAP